MDTYRTEEEQVEALRKWWDENGRSTIAAVVLALGVGFGWQGWQQHQKTAAEQVSARYDAMLEAARASGGASQVTTLRTLAEGIKSEFPDSTYAQFAALHLARLAVVEGDPEQAEAELRWVLTQGPAPEIRLLAELRLARVRASLGEPAEALEIVKAAEPGAYAPAYTEAEGDFYLQMDQRDQAIDAYERAVALAAASGVGASESLQLKLRALTPVPARELAAVEE